jgi:hypothetical protein
MRSAHTLTCPGQRVQQPGLAAGRLTRYKTGISCRCWLAAVHAERAVGAACCESPDISRVVAASWGATTCMGALHVQDTGDQMRGDSRESTCTVSNNSLLLLLLPGSNRGVRLHGPSLARSSRSCRSLDMHVVLQTRCCACQWVRAVEQCNNPTALMHGVAGSSSQQHRRTRQTTAGFLWAAMGR